MFYQPPSRRISSDCQTPSIARFKIRGGFRNKEYEPEPFFNFLDQTRILYYYFFRQMLQILIDHSEVFGALFESVCNDFVPGRKWSKRTPGYVGTTSTSCKLNLNIFNSYYFRFVSECVRCARLKVLTFPVGEAKNQSHPFTFVPELESESSGSHEQRSISSNIRHMLPVETS
jgi:hypothetical protein